MYVRLKRFIVHKLGGIFSDEIAENGTIQMTPTKTRTVSVIAEFDSVSPLIDPEQSRRIRKDLAAKIAEEMMQIGAIRFDDERMPPYSYLVKASARVILPEKEWW